MKNNTTISDTASEDCNSFESDSQTIKEIVTKARDVQRLQKPLLREIINPSTEDDIRRNYRRSIVHRAIRPNMITSTPCISSETHQYLNISSISELPTDVEDNLEKSRAQVEIKNQDTNKAIEILNISGLKLIENFKKPLPYVQNKTTDNSKLLPSKERHQTTAEGKRTNQLLYAETPKLQKKVRRRSESPNCSTVVSRHEANYENNEFITYQQKTPQTVTEEKHEMIHDDPDESAKKHKVSPNIVSDCSIDRTKKKKNKLNYGKALNDMNEDLASNLSKYHYRREEHTVEKPNNIVRQRYTYGKDSDISSIDSQKDLGNLNKKGSARGRAKEYNDRNDTSGFTDSTERHMGRSDKKVDLKCDKRHSKRKYKRNDSSSSDTECEMDERNNKTNTLKHRRIENSNYRRDTKFSSKRKYETSISSTPSVEDDQPRRHQDIIEDIPVRSKNRHLEKKSLMKSKSKPYRLVKCKKCAEEKISKKYKSVAKKSCSKAMRCSHYKYHRISSDSDETDDTDVTITKNRDNYYARQSKAKKNEIEKTKYAEEHENLKQPVVEIEAKVLSDFAKMSNSDCPPLSMQKKSIQQMIYSIVNEVIDAKTKKDTPIRNSVQGTKEISLSTQDLLKNVNFFSSGSDSNFSILRTPFNTNSKSECDTFRPSESPSISSKPERRFPNAAFLKKLARNPPKYDNQILSSDLTGFYYSKKKDIKYKSQNVGTGKKERKTVAKFQASKEKYPLNQNITPIPLNHLFRNMNVEKPSSPSQRKAIKAEFVSQLFRNMNFRKPPSRSERKAIKTKLDEVLGTYKNACDEKNSIIEDVPQAMVDATTQFSLHSHESVTNSKRDNTSRNREFNRLIEKISSIKSSTALTRKLSVGTQSSPFINNIVEATNVPVLAYNCSENISINSDEELRTDKNACDEKNSITAYLPQAIDAATQFSQHFHESVTNSKRDNTSRNRRSSRLMKRISPNKPSTALTRKLSVGTESSPFISNIVEATNVPVLAYNCSKNKSRNSDVILETYKNACNEKNSIIEDVPQALVDATTQFSQHSHESVTNTPRNRKSSRSIERISSNKPSKALTLKLSVGTQSSPFINNIVEATNCSKNISINSDEILRINKNACVEKNPIIGDVPQAMDATTQFSHRSHEFVTNREKRDNTLRNSKIKSRMELKFDADITSNRQGDTILDYFELKENFTSHDEIMIKVPSSKSNSYSAELKVKEVGRENTSNMSLTENCQRKEIAAHASKNDSLGNSAGSKNDKTSGNYYADEKDFPVSNSGNSDENVENIIAQRIKLLESPNLEEITNVNDIGKAAIAPSHLEKITNANDIGKEATAPHENVENSINIPEESKIKLLQNITLKDRDSISTSSKNMIPSVVLERINVAEEKVVSQPLVNNNKQTKKSSGRPKGSFARNKAAKYTEQQENHEKSEVLGIRKSSRDRRPPQVIWWKSAIAEKDVNLFQYFNCCERIRKHQKSAKQGENIKSSDDDIKGTVSKTNGIQKNRKQKSVATEKMPDTKRNTKKGTTKGNSHGKPSTSRASDKKVSVNDNNSSRQTPLVESKEEGFRNPANTISCREDSFDPGYATNSYMTDQEKLPLTSMSASAPTEVKVPRTRAKKITTDRHSLTKPKKSNLQVYSPQQNQFNMQGDNCDSGDPTTSVRNELKKVSFIDAISTNIDRSLLIKLFDHEQQDILKDIVVDEVQSVDIGQALSPQHHFGYLFLPPSGKKECINRQYDTVYFLLEGICTVYMENRRVIKGPKSFLYIKQDTPFRLENCENVRLDLVFICFKSN